jgi:DNA-binding NarL/FixJ family response regulator
MTVEIDAIKVVILEDDDLLRELLSEWLRGQPDTKVIDQFGTAAAFASAVETSVKDADILIIDVILPDGDGVEVALAAMQRTGTKPGLIVISAHANGDLFERLSKQMDGGWAFLLKNSNGLANLRQAIAAVRSGFVMVDPQLKRLSIDDSNELALTDQEKSIMQLVAEGKANAVIAREIFASEKTVERLLSQVYAKYGLAGTSKIENPRVRATLIFRGLAK